MIRGRRPTHFSRSKPGSSAWKRIALANTGTPETWAATSQREPTRCAGLRFVAGWSGQQLRPIHRSSDNVRCGFTLSAIAVPVPAIMASATTQPAPRRLISASMPSARTAKAIARASIMTSPKLPVSSGASYGGQRAGQRQIGWGPSGALGSGDGTAKSAFGLILPGGHGATPGRRGWSVSSDAHWRQPTL
jgi:hypothetical protein